MSLVNVHAVKTLIIRYGMYANILDEKMWVAFAFATHVFFLEKYLWIRYYTY